MEIGRAANEQRSIHWLALPPAYLCFASVRGAQAALREFEDRLQSCVLRMLASSVAISADHTEGFGSGFVVDRHRGLVVTNYHVVCGSEHVLVRRQREVASQPANVVSHDARNDLALLRVSDPTRLPRAVKVASERRWGVGQFVAAVGSPGGCDFSASLGIISAVDRHLAGAGTRLGLIQSDTPPDSPMEHGSSGGPLANLDCEVIGMNIRGDTRGAPAFAIPADVIAAFVANWRDKPV